MRLPGQSAAIPGEKLAAIAFLKLIEYGQQLLNGAIDGKELFWRHMALKGL
jgi:hypothetical protein